MLGTKRLLAAAVALLCANFAQADVLESAPAESLVAIKVANLAGTSAKIAKLANDFGITPFFPPIEDPLNAIKTQMKMEKGIKEDGELGVAILMPADGKREPSIIFLIPTANFADLVSNFADAKVEGGVAEVKMPGSRQAVHMADWGAYAAISQERDRVATKPAKTLKPAGAVAKDAAKQDFVVYANFAAITPELAPQLEKAIEEGVDQLNRALGPDGEIGREVPAQWHPVIRVAANQGFNVARAFLRDVESASIGIRISDAGINYTILSEFKTDSYIGKTIASLKNAEGPLTVGLPNIKYLVCGGTKTDPATTAKLFDDLAEPIMDELNKIEGQDKTKQLAKHIQAGLGANTSAIFGTPAPVKVGQDGIMQQVAVYKGAGKEMKAASRIGGEIISDLFVAMNAKAKERNPDAVENSFGTLVVTPNARTIDGLAFDTMKLNESRNPDDPAAMQAEMFANIFYGGQGMNYSVADFNGDFVLANSASDETIGKFLTALKANEDSVSKLEHVKVVADELPKSRFYEGYVFVDEWTNAGVGIAATFGLQVNVQLPPDLPPFGVTMGGEGTAFRIEAHLPRKTISQIIAAAMQAFQQMQQGGGGNI